ncbi:MAG: MFS transporter [Clostridiales bacterium]|nr:MFS transporter [Clostridiales bacterium]
MRNIIFLGLVSFFADVSTEMVYPLVPLCLTAAFGATPALVGVVEGIAESVASLLKVFSGYLSDRYQRKKPLAFLGYSTGILYKLLLVISASWAGVLAARVVDRLGKGLRTAPRDVMVAESADGAHVGQAFGVHKAMDMAGAGLGILIAWLLMAPDSGVSSFRAIFLWSLLPGVLALGMFAFIREKRGPRAPAGRMSPFAHARELDGSLKLYLAVVTMFTLGNSSNAFLLLRAQAFGFTARQAVLMYFVYHVSASLLAISLGRLSDRVGRKSLLVGGYLLFSLVYALFAWVNEGWMMWAAFGLYGLFTAMTTGVERAFIAQIAPGHLKGTMLGLHGTLTGVALLPAGALAGLLWTQVGPQAPFALGAALSLAAALILHFLMQRPKGASR